jgi:hypothetical protein
VSSDLRAVSNGFLGLEAARFLVHDVLSEVEHVFGDFDGLDLVEVFVLGPHLVRIAQQRADQSLLQRLERNDVLAVGQDHAADSDLIHFPDGLADHGEGVVPDLAVRTQIVRADQVARIDFGFFDELVDLDGAGGFKCDPSSSSFVTSMNWSFSSW